MRMRRSPPLGSFPRSPPSIQMLIESANKTFFCVWESTERMGVIFFLAWRISGIISAAYYPGGDCIFGGGGCCWRNAAFSLRPSHLIVSRKKRGGKLYGEIILPEAAFLRL